MAQPNPLHPVRPEEEAWLHCTVEGDVLAASDAFLGLFGFGSEDGLREAVPRIHDLFGDRAARARVQPPLAETLPAEEVRWLRRDGTSLWVRVNVDPVPALERIDDVAGAGSGAGLASTPELPVLEVTVVDVTGRRHLEEQLRHAHKMEALGQLAGGMANDLHNLLTATLAHVDLLATGIEKGDTDRVQAELGEIRDTATRSSQMIKHLLSFSRGERLRLRALPLAEVVRDSLRLVRPLLPEDVALDLSVREVGPVLADPSAVEKIILSLATNAVAAMPDGGRLQIEAGAGGFDEEHLTQAGWGDVGDYGVVTVTDTGKGMSPQTVAKLFQPFFSATDRPGDWGLSMSMVYGIMKQHRGFIHVESEPERGTQVRLYFRLAESRARGDVPEQPAHPSERETILFVEDDENLREVTCRILRAQGYRVLEAGDGKQALAVMEREGRPDLMIADLVMPSMSGIELVENVSGEGDSPRILLTSGFRPEFLLGWDEEPSRHPFLEKPWKIDRLLEAVREVLG